MTTVKPFILSIDQGTSSTKTIVFDAQANVVTRAVEPLKTHYLEDGFVEQEPEEIYHNVLASVKKCLTDLEKNGGNVTDIITCGISNQRETFVVWDNSGKPLYNAVVWQCKRSVDVCKALSDEGLEQEIRTKTGLLIDPYFSGTKLIWLNQNNETVKTAIAAGNAFFGTVDTWLLYKLTNGAAYYTDYTNASRTLFFNLHSLQWDEELLARFSLSNLNLPELRPSSAHFGETDFDGLLKNPVAISSMIGDSHAAAFGEGCFAEGTAKATLGTGCSFLMNIGNEAKPSANGMVTTICWSTEQQVEYAFEGVIVSCGATIEWLKNELGIINDLKETATMATSVVDNGGVYLVPAFSGLGAPHWEMNRKAAITGLSFNINKNHIVRAGLESIAYQIKDVIQAMQADAGKTLKELMIHGGLTNNTFMMQFLADMLDCGVIRSHMPDISALGAALLAGLKAGVFTDLVSIKKLCNKNTLIARQDNKPKMNIYYKGWQNAIAGI